MEGICFVDAIHLVGDKAEISNECRGCGRCVEICPENAIKLIISNKQFIQDSIDKIEKVIDVS